VNGSGQDLHFINEITKRNDNSHKQIITFAEEGVAQRLALPAGGRDEATLL